MVLIVAPTMRVMYQGEIYSIIGIDILPRLTSDFSGIEFYQSYTLAKTEPAAVDGFNLVYASSEECYILPGNDFYIHTLAHL